MQEMNTGNTCLNALKCFDNERITDTAMKLVEYTERARRSGLLDLEQAFHNSSDEMFRKGGEVIMRNLQCILKQDLKTLARLNWILRDQRLMNLTISKSETDALFFFSTNNGKRGFDEQFNHFCAILPIDQARISAIKEAARILHQCIASRKHMILKDRSSVFLKNYMAIISGIVPKKERTMFLLKLFYQVVFDRDRYDRMIIRGMNLVIDGVTPLIMFNHLCGFLFKHESDELLAWMEENKHI